MALWSGALVALGQSGPYGLTAIKSSEGPERMEKKPTSSRLFILGPTNEYHMPVLRLAITDKPFMVGDLTLFEATIVTESNAMQTYKIPLVTNYFPHTEYSQIIDVPITNGPVTQMLAAMFNSPARATVAVDVVDGDHPDQSKSYIVPRPALDELRRQYLLLVKSSAAETH